ncbi:anthranilate phosphoribosyltransferase [Rubrobacter indicoceani]|uniref:anthranilate phosphoribosyltransferase n=1 Tax=Rubrobacter indicoceani TaxID=2051957 RepID=UPI0013C5185F|nr:hypothetical protein [Rubrobacter indicoceani]
MLRPPGTARRGGLTLTQTPEQRTYYRPGEAFRELLRERARGPASVGPLAPEVCERAMCEILSGGATPAQAAGFLLVGRAAGDSPEELAAYTRALRGFVRELPADRPTVSVAGGFDGKLRTANIGAAASMVAAAAGARVVMVGGEGISPKEGRTGFDALKNLGIPAPQTLAEAAGSLGRHGLAATSPEHYLPALHALTPLRWEMTRRTVLNVVEKLVSPVTGASLMVGVTHASSMKGVPEALLELGTPPALVYQAVEGSDEAALDGTSALVLLRDGELEPFRVEPESLGLGRATRSELPPPQEKEEACVLEAVLAGEPGPVADLIIYNAALRLWMSEGAIGELRDLVERAREAVRSGRAAEHLQGLRAAGQGVSDAPAD